MWKVIVGALGAIGTLVTILIWSCFRSGAKADKHSDAITKQMAKTKGLVK